MSDHEPLSRRQLLQRAGAGSAILAGGSLLAACGGSSPSSGSKTSGAAGSPAAGRPKKGGTLRIAIAGGSSADNPDPHVAQNASQTFYGFALYDQLNQVDGEMKLQLRLAEEITPNKRADAWTVRLRDGLEFHNGKTVTADDVIFSFKRMLDPEAHTTGAGQLAMIDSMKKVDARTVRFDLKAPTGWFDLAIGDGGVFGIVPEDFDIKKPVGTGPWMFDTYTRGQQMTFKRFPNYFDGPPLLDALVAPLINDDQARLNALISGQIDAISALLPSQIAQLQNQPNVRIYNSPTGQFQPISMRCDQPPFDDVRVRQAMRLCLDRKQAIESSYAGQGQLGHDVYGRYDEAYDKSLVREQDLEQAKALLKQSGASVNVELVTSNLGPGFVESCQVLAENAKQAGMNVKVRQADPGTLFGPNYLQWKFSVDTYPSLSYLTIASLADGPHPSINTSHFEDATYNKLYEKASSTLDATARKDAVVEMQKLFFEKGGWIVFGFPNQPGAYSSKLAGFPERDVRGFGMGTGALNRVGFV